MTERSNLADLFFILAGLIFRSQHNWHNVTIQYFNPLADC
jgi:hypothetical protein